MLQISSVRSCCLSWVSPTSWHIESSSEKASIENFLYSLQFPLTYYLKYHESSNTLSMSVHENIKRVSRVRNFQYSRVIANGNNLTTYTRHQPPQDFHNLSKIPAARENQASNPPTRNFVSLIQKPITPPQHSG